MDYGYPTGVSYYPEKTREGPAPSQSLSSISATNQVREVIMVEDSAPINYREKARKEQEAWSERVWDEVWLKVLSGEVDPECPKFLAWDAVCCNQLNNRSL